MGPYFAALQSRVSDPEEGGFQRRDGRGFPGRAEGEIRRKAENTGRLRRRAS